MEKHAADLASILDHLEIGRVPFAGVSIGGYVLFEFWRRYRGRVAALALCNTKAPADSPEARAVRLQAATDVVERGTEPFFESMVPKLIGQTTRDQPSRPGGWRVAHDEKNVGGECCAGSARHGGASRLGD